MEVTMLPRWWLHTTCSIVVSSRINKSKLTCCCAMDYEPFLHMHSITKNLMLGLLLFHRAQKPHGSSASSSPVLKQNGGYLVAALVSLVALLVAAHWSNLPARCQIICCLQGRKIGHVVRVLRFRQLGGNPAIVHQGICRDFNRIVYCLSLRNWEWCAALRWFFCLGFI
jgi:hypothetical protein